MRKIFYLFIFAFLPLFMNAQFTPSEDGLTIIVTDGTFEGTNSEIQPPSDLKFQSPIRPLGMADAIQAAAFLERPDYGLTGFILVFCVNDSIGGKQGMVNINGEVYNGVYRLIRQKMTIDEEVPEGMTPYRLTGTVYFLGIS